MSWGPRFTGIRLDWSRYSSGLPATKSNILQSFSALKKFNCALARAQPENMHSRSRSIFARPCAHARAQNVLSAAQFCAYFRFFKDWKGATNQWYFGIWHLFRAIFSWHLKKIPPKSWRMLEYHYFPTFQLSNFPNSKMCAKLSGAQNVLSASVSARANFLAERELERSQIYWAH